jgi:hypothetical protein
MHERLFINPVDGELHPESWYQHQNIDLRCVIEAYIVEDKLAFDIRPENIERMEFGDLRVIEMIAQFTSALAFQAMKMEDPEEAAECASIAAYVSKVMMMKLESGKITTH